MSAWLGFLRKTCSAALRPAYVESGRCDTAVEGRELAFLVLFVLKMPDDLPEQGAIFVAQLLLLRHAGCLDIFGAPASHDALNNLRKM